MAASAGASTCTHTSSNHYSYIRTYVATSLTRVQVSVFAYIQQVDIIKSKNQALQILYFV